MIIKALLTCIFIAGFAVSLPAQSLVSASEELNDVYKSIVNTEEKEFVFIYLNEQYDTQKLYNQVKNLDKPQRREKTIEILTGFGDKTQANLRPIINILEKEGLVERVSYFWLTNIIGMKASAQALKTLDGHPDIKTIEHDPLVPMLDDLPENEYSDDGVDTLTYNTTSRLRRDNHRAEAETKTRQITYNVNRMNAPAVWEQGYKGQGTVVAVLDTGVNYEHRDIRNRMWTHPDYPNHGYNYVENNFETMDIHSHGTHVAGTVAGDGSAGTRTGVAPESKIMALKILSDEGSGNMQFSLSAFQFSVQFGADIINGSFGSMDANAIARRARRESLNNVLSAGVIASISAGNSGNEQDEYPIPRNIGAPSDCPPPWLHPDQTLIGGRSAVVSIGATDSNDRIANFSSRGPTTWENVNPFNDYPYDPEIGLIKPDVSAPGVNIRSLRHDNNSGYTNKSGTSMAAPGVSGVLALMLSKDPLLTPERLCQILEETADPMTETKSNTFGSGIVDAEAASKRIKYIEVEHFSISGTDDNRPQYGKTVSLSVALANNSSSQATNVTATLYTENEYVDIVRNVNNFGDIEGGDISNINDAFTVRLADNIPHDTLVELSININPANDNHSWYDHIYFRVNAPKLATLSPIIYDPEPGGNHNGIIEPGEDLSLFVPVANIGGSPSLPVSVNINTDSDYVTINNISDEYFSFVKDGEKMFPEVQISVSEDIETGSIILFDYSYQTGSYRFHGTFSALVGESIQAQIGEGEDFTEAADASPISIYFRALRSQTVYTAEELTEAGASGPIPLSRIGYYVASAPAHSLPDFTVRMRHTTAEDASQHIEEPYSTVLVLDHYTPQQGQWDMLELDTPFLWNGQDNILIDTSFSPANSWDESGQVRIFDSENGFRYVRHDSQNQINTPTNRAVNYKPQIRMLFEVTQGIDPHSPQNTTAALQNEAVTIQWERPENRSGGRSRRVADRNQTSTTRNPIGYNVYRNGSKINEQIVTTLGYQDRDIQPSASYYYYVTAVYDNFESSPSNISAVRGIAPPQYDPPAGIRSNPFFLSISSLTDDIRIYYTLDGSEPSEDASLYEEPFEIHNDTKVKAIAFKEGYLPSTISSADYKFLGQPQHVSVRPSINFAMISWDNPENRNLKTDQDYSEQIRSTRVGRERDKLHQQRSFAGYNIYRSDNSGPFNRLNEFMVVDNDYIDSEIKPGRYQYSITAVYEEGESEPTEPVTAYIGMVATPTFDPEPGVFNESFDLTIHCMTDEATIRYTTDGSEPTPNSTIYTGEPIRVEDDKKVKAYATLPGWKDSNIVAGLFEIDTTDIEDDTVKPYVTELYQAYPNPFNPATNIGFSLADESEVSLKVYNIKGQLVKSLVDDNLPQGIHNIVWQGTNNKGMRVGSGVYFYRLSTSDYDKVRKVLMIK